jgi:phage terminase large subunit-like protein
MATRDNAQILITSTAGTDASVFLRRKVEAGRAAVDADFDSGIAYFEWSAPDGANPNDREVWRACMPALGFTISEETVEHARKSMTEDEFRRSYLNQWTKSDERVIPLTVWKHVISETVAPSGYLVFAADATPDRSAATIAVADQDGRGEIVDYRPGVSWLIPRLTELSAKWNTDIVIDPYGPASNIADKLEETGIGIVRYAARQMASACGSFFDRVADRTVSIRYSEPLETAVAAARKRPLGDAWAWARKDLTADISPLVALTLALHRAQQETQSVQVMVV